MGEINSKYNYYFLQWRVLQLSKRLQRRLWEFWGSFWKESLIVRSTVKARADLSLVRPIVEYATVAWSPHTNKGIDCSLTVTNLFNTAQHVLLTAITAAIVAFHLCLLIWTGLRCSHTLPDLSRKIEGPRLAGYCSQGAGYAISACFIRFIEVKSTSPFPTSLPPCLRMAVQGRVNDFKIRLPSSWVDAYKLSFYVRSIPAWNALSSDVLR